MGYWTLDNNKNMREFMETISRKSGCDPLIPTNWYSKNKNFLLGKPVSFLSSTCVFPLTVIGRSHNIEPL